MGDGRITQTVLAAKSHYRKRALIKRCKNGLTLLSANEQTSSLIGSDDTK